MSLKRKYDCLKHKKNRELQNSQIAQDKIKYWQQQISEQEVIKETSTKLLREQSLQLSLLEYKIKLYEKEFKPLGFVDELFEIIFEYSVSLMFVLEDRHDNQCWIEEKDIIISYIDNSYMLDFSLDLIKQNFCCSCGLNLKEFDHTKCINYYIFCSQCGNDIHLGEYHYNCFDEDCIHKVMCIYYLGVFQLSDFHFSITKKLKENLNMNSFIIDLNTIFNDKTFNPYDLNNFKFDDIGTYGEYLKK